MTTIKTVNEFRCNHCGLTDQGATPSECPRCSRTFFTTRRVTSAAEWARLNETELKRQIAQSEERVARRRRVAADIKKLLATGWWGFRIVADKSERREIARKAIAEAK